MSYTEQDVERVKRAMYEAYPTKLVGGDSDRILSYDEWVEYFGDDEVFWQSDWQSDMRELDLHARAALEAMAREPLEDVLRGWDELTAKMDDGVWVVDLCQSLWGNRGQLVGRRCTRGTGATIDDAIRAAVAAAGEER